MYSIHLLYDDGRGSYLSVKGRSTWKTKKIAVKHAKDIICAVGKGGAFSNIVEITIENEFCETVQNIWRV